MVVSDRPVTFFPVMCNVFLLFVKELALFCIYFVFIFCNIFVSIYLFIVHMVHLSTCDF